MKRYVGLLAVLLAGCAANPSTPTAADNGPVARCTVSKCFNARDVRSVQIVDASTAVAYVGQQRCPFVVDLDGINCSPTFGPGIRLPQIQFYQGGGAANANIGLSPRVCSADQQLYLYTGLPNPGPLTPDGAIDPVTGRPLGLGMPADSPVRPLGGISTLPPYGNGELGSLGPSSAGGGPASVPVVPLNSRDLCRVRDIHSITDDQLVELYVKAGFTPPPPPIGSGKIEVPAAQSQDSSAPAAAGSARSASAQPAAATGGASASAHPATAAPSASVHPPAGGPAASPAPSTAAGAAK